MYALLISSLCFQCKNTDTNSKCRTKKYIDYYCVVQKIRVYLKDSISGDDSSYIPLLKVMY